MVQVCFKTGANASDSRCTDICSQGYICLCTTASQPASSAFRQITLAYHALLSALDMQLTNFIYKLWAALLAEGPINTHAHTPVTLHSYMVSIRNC